ncbi:MAG: ParA family protein [Bacillota bacterium]|nr:ParA family protein [Bacillota bacterium]
MGENTRVIAIANQKGGVAKTTTAFHLGFGLAERGKNVLLIDLDPQGNLSACFGCEEPDTLTYNVSDLLSREIGKSDKTFTLDDVVHRRENIALLPGNCYLTNVEQLINAEQFGRESVLKRVLEELYNEYDFVVIDCSPTLNVLSLNALVAADDVIVPFAPRKLSVQSIGQLMGTIEAVKKVGYNPNLKVAGFLPTMVQKNIKVCQKSIETVRKEYEEAVPVFENSIPLNNNIEKATLANKPIFQLYPNDIAARAYEAFIGEYLAKC